VLLLTTLATLLLAIFGNTVAMRIGTGRVELPTAQYMASVPPSHSPPVPHWKRQIKLNFLDEFHAIPANSDVHQLVTHTHTHKHKHTHTHTHKHTHTHTHTHNHAHTKRHAHTHTHTHTHTQTLTHKHTHTHTHTHIHTQVSPYLHRGLGGRTEYGPGAHNTHTDTHTHTHTLTHTYTHTHTHTHSLVSG
jgi:hypothetical protein